MDHGQTTLAELLSEIKSLNQVRFRIALVKKDHEWSLFAGVIDNLPESGRPSWTAYDYGRVAFLAGTLPGGEIAGWLGSNEGKAHNYEFQVSSRHSSIHWTRYPSHTHYGFIGAGVPFTNYQIHVAGRPEAPNSLGFLVSDASPFFPDFNTAIWQLLFDTVDQSRAGTLSGELMDVRLSDKRAWIDSLQITPAVMTVHVLGEEVNGTRLEVWPALDSWTSQRLEGVGDVAIPLPAGVPSGTWVALSRDREVLDYRQLVPPSGYGPTVDNLTIEVNTVTHLEQLISRGEGESIEFKSQVSGNNKDKLLRTVAAFANGIGGTILIGVEDNGMVAGINLSIGVEKDRISNMIRTSVTPEPSIRLQDGKVEGKDIVAVYVDKGSAPPYGLLPDPPKFYVRRGATTVPARQHEVRALGQRNTPSPLQNGWV